MTRGRVARAVDFGDVLLGLLQSGGLRTPRRAEAATGIRPAISNVNVCLVLDRLPRYLRGRL